MTKEECEARINSVFEPEGLLSTIREGVLDPGKLDELADAVGTLNALDLDAAHRGRLAAILWEFAFHVSNCIAWHHNKMVMYSFDQVSDQQLRALNNMVYWLSNGFTYKKALEKEDLRFAGYMRWDGVDPSVPLDPSKTS